MLKNFMWLTLCIYFEARGEPKEAQIMVGHVVMNRVKKDGLSIKEVVNEPWQFSWMNSNSSPVIQDYNALYNCQDAAFEVLSQRLDGKDGFGADHYYDDSIEPPYWAEQMQVVGKVGRIYFFKSS